MTSDPSAQGQPSQEEMRAYVEQLRTADPSEIVAQAYTMLGTGAEVKLGRSDARVLIDAMGALVQATEGKVPDELTQGMRNGLGQLQTAQVQMEQQAGAGGDQGHRQPQPPQTGAAASPQQPAAPSQKDEPKTNRLWIPGQ